MNSPRSLLATVLLFGVAAGCAPGGFTKEAARAWAVANMVAAGKKPEVLPGSDNVRWRAGRPPRVEPPKGLRPWPPEPTEVKLRGGGKLVFVILQLDSGPPNPCKLGETCHTFGGRKARWWGVVLRHSRDQKTDVVWMSLPQGKWAYGRVQFRREQRRGFHFRLGGKSCMPSAADLRRLSRTNAKDVSSFHFKMRIGFQGLDDVHFDADGNFKR